jgi:hypothetical protein
MTTSKGYPFHLLVTGHSEARRIFKRIEVSTKGSSLRFETLHESIHSFIRLYKFDVNKTDRFE